MTGLRLFDGGGGDVDPENAIIRLLQELRHAAFAATDFQHGRKIVVVENFQGQPMAQVAHVLALPAVEPFRVLGLVHVFEGADEAFALFVEYIFVVLGHGHSPYWATWAAAVFSGTSTASMRARVRIGSEVDATRRSDVTAAPQLRSARIFRVSSL